MKLSESFVLVVMLKKGPCMPSWGLQSHDRRHWLSQSDYKFANNQPLLSHATAVLPHTLLLHTAISTSVLQKQCMRQCRLVIIMDSNSLMLLGWGSWCFSKRRGISLDTCVHAVFYLYYSETLGASIKQWWATITHTIFWDWHVHFLKDNILWNRLLFPIM